MEPVTAFVVFMLGAIVGIILVSRFSYQKRPNDPELLPTQVLKIQDGSIVVLRVSGALSPESAARLKAHWEKNIVPGAKCVVLGDGLSVNCVLDPSKP